MTVLKRDDILKAQDIQKELVPVPEWGGDVYVRGMTGTERDKFEAGIFQARGSKLTLADLRARLASLTICDENGKRLFSDADVVKLGEKSAAALQRVFLVGQKLSGIGESSVAEYKEQLVENPLEGSASDSLSQSAAQSESS